jgi:hypothetical protein
MKILGKARDLLAINGSSPGAIRQINPVRSNDPICGDLSGHNRAIAFPTHQLARTTASQGLECCQKPDRLKYIRLSLGIFPMKDDKSGIRGQPKWSEVSKPLCG